MKFVVYGEFGQYCVDHNEIEVETVGSPMALKRLKNRYAKKWAVYGDNWAGWLNARIFLFKGTMEEFHAKYPKLSQPHYITGCQYRIGVFKD